MKKTKQKPWDIPELRETMLHMYGYKSPATKALDKILVEALVPGKELTVDDYFSYIEQIDNIVAA